MYAGYNGRRAPNVSQYLSNLNALPSAQDAQPDLNLADDIDFLTNAQFVDFDAEFNAANGYNAQPQDLPQRVGGGENAQPFDFPDFTTYPTAATGVTSPSDIQSPSTGLPYSADFNPSPTTGLKRTASTAALPATGDLEDISRHAAEEDKRRRNTAASARFRVKKKQREQALEKQAKEMTDKVSLLEGKVQALERENKWLKELITEKNNIVKQPMSAKADRPAAATVERSTESRTDGVGTQLPRKVEAVKPEA